MLNEVNDFYKTLNSVDAKLQTYWSNLYADIVNSSENPRDQDNLLETYEFLNKMSSTKRLYHEIKKDIGDFEAKINPLELFVPKIVTPRIIDQRIKNQRGLFMFVPFVYNYGFEESEKKVALNSDEIQNRTQTRINILRLLSDSIDPQPKPMAFVIPHCKKASIRSELESVGITESFIYPDPSHVAHEISKTY